MVLLEFRPAQLLVLLCSATLLAQVVSADTNSSADSRAKRSSAQIAHHTELPYIRDPVDPSNDVSPLGGNDDGAEAPPSTDAVSNATDESNNEDNNVGLVDQIDMEEISGRVLPIALQTIVPHLTIGRSPVYPEHPPSPPSYGASRPFPGLPSTPDYGVRTFQCTFEDHTCGMRNQKNIGPNFKLVTNSIASRPGSYMAVDAAAVGYGVSRLITPYLPGRPNALICLRLTYIINGPGAERIEIVAQDTGNRHLFILENHGPVWRTFGINMTVTQDVRFFWHAESDSLFSCSDDQHLVHWSVSSCKVKSKWKADRHSIHAVATIDASTVLSASSSIKWWNVETKTVVMKFTGHVTEVRQLLPVFVPSKSGEEGRTYFLSSAVNDRQLSAWHLQKGGSTSSLANFMLSDEAVLMGVSSPAEAGKMAYLSAVTRSGSLHVFELQLNGRCKTPLQPKFTIQIASEAQNGRAPKPQPVPVLAAAFSQDDALVMCYNSFLRPSFERLSISSPELQAQTWLVRQVQPPVPCTVEDGVSLVKQPVQPSREVTTLAPGHLAPNVREAKKQAGPVTQLPMEERLRAIDTAAITQSTGNRREPPRADNLSQLLLQGLQSDDPKLLNSVLQRTDEMLIKNTVRRLPLSSILSLLKELHKRMHSRGSGVFPYMKWTKALIATHTSYLMTCQEANALLTPLLELLEARTEVFDKVCRLRGRVDLIMSQVAARHEDTKVSMEPLCVVQIESSDDEDMDQDSSEEEEEEENNMWELSEDEGSQSDEAKRNAADGEEDEEEAGSAEEENSEDGLLDDSDSA